MKLLSIVSLLTAVVAMAYVFLLGIEFLSYSPLILSALAIGFLGTAASRALRAISDRQVLREFEHSTGLVLRDLLGDGSHVTTASAAGAISLWEASKVEGTTEFLYCGDFSNDNAGLSGFEFKPEPTGGSASDRNASFKQQVSAAFARNGLEVIAAPDVQNGVQTVVTRDHNNGHTLCFWSVTYSEVQDRISCFPSLFGSLTSISYR